MFLGLFVDALIYNVQLDINDSDLVWDVASSASATTTPNILSELSFNDIKSQGYILNVGYLNRFNKSWAFILETEYANSKISSGRAQDSDYELDNRMDEFQRGYSDIEEDSISHYSLTTGLKTRWFNQKKHYLSFLVGYKVDEVDITMSNGVYALPEEDAGFKIPGLIATYNSEFKSILAGLSTEHVFSWGAIGLSYELYNTKLNAEADWMLREDYAHPISFVHFGDGVGHSLKLGYTYRINRNWDYSIDYVSSEYHIKNGYDHTFFSNSTSSVIKLNNSKYEQESIRLGVSFNF